MCYLFIVYKLITIIDGSQLEPERRGWKGEEAAWNERVCLRGRLRTAWVQGSGWKLGMSEFGCAGGCGQRGCKGVAGNGWGEEAAGDERAWLRRRLRTAWVKGVGGNGWTKKKRWG